MRFIKLTGFRTRVPVYINCNSISAIDTNDTQTEIFIAGDNDPFVVRETPEEVLQLIREAVVFI